MRIVATALGLAVALSASCASRKERSEPNREMERPVAEAAPQEETRPAQAGQGAPMGDYAAQQATELTLQEQKKSFLVESHIQRAQELKDRLQLEDAERELALALELDPDNLEAKDMLAEVGTLLGRGPGEAQTTIRALEDAVRMKRDQLEVSAREKLDRARLAMARGDNDAALVELTLAQDELSWSPYSGNWPELQNEIKGLIQTAKGEKEARAAELRQRMEKEALADLQTKEQAEQQRKKQIVSNLLSQAIAAFRAQDYDEAMDLADRVLRLDPRNERALDLRDTAFRKGRDLVREEFLDHKLEQYQRWKEDIDELRIPYQGVVTLPDEDYWRDISARRASRTDFLKGESQSPAALELRRQLASTRLPGLSVRDEESLTAVVRSVNAISGIPMIVDPAAEQAAVDEGIVYNIDLSNPITVDKVLNLITQSSGSEVTWTIRHDTVLVTTRAKARGELIIVNHDVHDLIFGLTDFLSPRIDRLRLLDDLEDDDDNSGGAFGRIGERLATNQDDVLVELIRSNVEKTSWDEDGVNIDLQGGNLLVVHSADVQLKVRDFLEELRRFSSSLVTIESKFLIIGDNFLQEVGVDFRGLDNPGVPFTDLDDVNFGQDPTLGLDNSGDGETLTPPSAGAFYDEGNDGDFRGRTENFFNDALGSALTNIGGLTAQYTFLNDLQLSAIFRLVEKSENVELINSQVLSVLNTQRAYVTVVNQQAYVQDFDVEVAQLEAVADPQINVLTEGIVLDVRPIIQHNRRYLTLEIQPTVAQVVALREFSTTLAGQTAAVTFQLPELEVQSVFTTAIVPDGGSILIGGLSRLRNVERRAEVPWLANVPILGFFFKDEGYSDERESLMILIRAWITDVKEELARFEGR